MKKQLHTPEGVRDLVGRECERKHIIDHKIKETIQSYGYEQIETPTFEYFDIFSQKIGSIPSKDLYKFFDREGDTLVLRPDVTPAIARAYSNYFQGQAPIRLFYSGNVYINYSSLQGRLKETTQIGAEFIGDTSIEADAEMVSMAVEALKATGLSEFTISIGHTGFLKGLLEACHFSAEEEEIVRELILNKNFFGLDDLLSRVDDNDKLRELYASLGKLFMEPSHMAELKALVLDYPYIQESFAYIEQLYELLELYGVAEHVAFELGLVSSYRYYTGILFCGYTFGSGEAILKGGRYDGLLSFFGRDEPAIGFAILSDQLSLALDRQKITIPIAGIHRAYLYTKDTVKDAIRLSQQDRTDGMRVRLFRLPDGEDQITELEDRLKKDGIEIVRLQDGWR